jgi:hypothetical protein
MNGHRSRRQRIQLYCSLKPVRSLARLARKNVAVSAIFQVLRSNPETERARICVVGTSYGIAVLRQLNGRQEIPKR